MHDVKAGARRLPGDEGVWFFICADAVFFLLLFGTYSYYRLHGAVGFSADQAHLHPMMAAINTIFLLTSSWWVAQAVLCSRIENHARVITALRWSVLFGLAFIITKITEYAIVIQEGVDLGGSQFFMYYFVITGMHLLHVIVGLCVLIYCLGQTKSPKGGVKSQYVLESAASFWHMVDILWLFIFPLFYLLGQRVI